MYLSILKKLLTNMYIYFKNNIIFKKYDVIPNKLIFMICIVYIFFCIIFLILILYPNNDLFTMTLNNALLCKLVTIGKKITPIKLITNLLGITLTPNNQQILSLLILSFFISIIFFLFIIFFRQLVFFSIIFFSTISLIIIKIITNYFVLSNNTVLNFKGIKLFIPLTDSERLQYLEKYCLEKQIILEKQKLILNSKFNKDKLFNLISTENDINEIKKTIFTISDNYVEKKCNINDINIMINEILDNLTDKSKNYLINRTELINNIQTLDLKGDIEIKDYLINIILEKINQLPNNNNNVFFLSDINI